MSEENASVVTRSQNEINVGEETLTREKKREANKKCFSFLVKYLKNFKKVLAILKMLY